MEWLYHINPILQDKVLVIYGIGEREKGIFLALLQQNIYVAAFCVKEEQKNTVKRLYNKKIIDLQQLKEDYADAYVVISGQDAETDADTLANYGIKNIIVENISLKNKGILFVAEYDDEIIVN